MAIDLAGSPGRWRLDGLPGGKASAASPIPLSPAQMPIWYAELLAPGTSRWTIVTAVHLDGPVDLDRLVAAARSVVPRFAALRTRLNLRGRRAQQTILDDDPDTVEVVDATGDLDGTGERRLAAECRRPFEVHAGALHRVLILKTGRDRHLLVMRQHHAIIDAPGIGVVLRHIAQAYAGCDAGPVAASRSYEDWLVRRRDPTSMPGFAAALAHAGTTLTGARLHHHKIYDADEPPAAQETGAFHILDIGRPLAAERADALKAFAARSGCSPFIVFLAAYALALVGRTAADDLTIGVTVAGRSGEADDLVGMCINMVLLRLPRIEPEAAPRALIRRTAEAWAAWKPLQDVPLFWLNQAAPAGVIPTRTQFMINMLDVRRTPFPAPGLEARVRYPTTGYPTADLAFTPTYLEDGSLDLRLYVGTPRISPASAERLLREIDETLASWLRSSEEGH